MLLRNKIEIENWLNQYSVKNYELIPNEEYGYVVNVNENVYLNNKNLKSIDVKFNIIHGDFDCSTNCLTSLNGCPKIVNKDFYCFNNELKTLEYSPEIVGKDFFCSNNDLISLNKVKIIKGSFYCNNNNLNIYGLKKLLISEINGVYINLKDNKELGELQNITDFNELKKILTIYQEKESIDKSIENLDFLMNKKSTDKSIKENKNLLDKINKI